VFCKLNDIDLQNDDAYIPYTWTHNMFVQIAKSRSYKSLNPNAKVHQRCESSSSNQHPSRIQHPTITGSVSWRGLRLREGFTWPEEIETVCLVM